MTTESRIQDYLKVLLAFRSLPETKRTRTFMEISGFPHYENVCSNILEFYFDPEAEHGLRDLVLSSFLHITGQGNFIIPERLTLTREYPAEDEKRIDLVIDCEVFIVAIENKIFHWEANDFELYSRTINRVAGTKAVVKTVLCLKKAPKQNALAGGFLRYTYQELWNEVRKRIGSYLHHANPKWVTCLLDFMETTINLAGKDMELKQSDRFFVEHHKDIKRLVDEYNGLIVRLHQRVSQVLAAVEDAPEAKQLSGKPWIYQKSCLVLDFNSMNGCQVHLNLWIDMARGSDGCPGWDLHLFGKRSEDESYLDELIKDPALSPRVSGKRVWGSRYLLAQWPLEADLNQICDELRSWIGTITSATTASNPK